MPIESRPGYTRPGTRPPQTPLPPMYDPPVAPYVPPATGGSNVVQPGSTGISPQPGKAQMPTNGFFGFVMLMMGLK